MSGTSVHKKGFCIFIGCLESPLGVIYLLASISSTISAMQSALASRNEVFCFTQHCLQTSAKSRDCLMVAIVLGTRGLPWWFLKALVSWSVWVAAWTPNLSFWRPELLASPGKGFSPHLSCPLKQGSCAGEQLVPIHLVHVPGMPFNITQHCYCLKHLHDIIDLLKWTTFWLSPSLKNTEYFPDCLKFDDSSQLRAALSSEPNANSGIIPRGWSTRSLRQESVCLVQTEGVTHQAVWGCVFKIDGLNISFCALLRWCYEFIFLSGGFSFPPLAAATAAIPFSLAFASRLGWFLSFFCFNSKLPSLLSFFCSAFVVYDGSFICFSKFLCGALVSCITLQGLLIFNSYLSRDEGLE